MVTWAAASIGVLLRPADRTSTTLLAILQEVDALFVARAKQHDTILEMLLARDTAARFGWPSQVRASLQYAPQPLTITETLSFQDKQS